MQTRSEDGLGELTWDVELGTWLGQVQISGEDVDLEVVPINPDIPDELGGAIERARDLLAALPERDPELRAFTARDLVEGSDAMTGRLTADQVAQRLRLAGVSVYPDGEAELWFTGGELFDGHEVCVPLDPQGAPGEPDVVG